MGLPDSLFKTSASVSEAEARHLRYGSFNQNSIEVRPPNKEDIPATVDSVLRATREIQSKWFGFVNASPVTAFEVRRPHPDQLKFVFSVPTFRLERKFRTLLDTEIQGIQIHSGDNGIPISEGESIGGGVMTLGRKDCYPLKTEFESPPLNALTGILHRHGMQEKVIVQILSQPTVGHPLKHWWWTRNAYQRLGYLRKEKPGTLPWHDRPPTPRERGQADAIERKAASSKFHTTIRFLVIGADDNIQSRVKELAGGFQVFENPDTGQHFDPITVSHIRRNPVIKFAEAVANRRFSGTPRFRLSLDELAGLVSIPDKKQGNIERAKP